MFRNHKEFKNEEERMDVQYQNYLQQPLQPLMNNLSSGTYEVFEHDSKKYQRYEEAILSALVDFINRGQFNKTLGIQEAAQEEEIDKYVEKVKLEAEKMKEQKKKLIT